MCKSFRHFATSQGLTSLKLCKVFLYFSLLLSLSSFHSACLTLTFFFFFLFSFFPFLPFHFIFFCLFCFSISSSLVFTLPFPVPLSSPLFALLSFPTSLSLTGFHILIPFNSLPPISSPCSFLPPFFPLPPSSPFLFFPHIPSPVSFLPIFAPSFHPTLLSFQPFFPSHLSSVLASLFPPFSRPALPATFRSPSQYQAASRVRFEG